MVSYADGHVDLSRTLKHRSAINDVISDLQALPCGHLITVFGSVARGVGHPGDVDVHLAGDDPIGQAALLRLARRHYPLLDPFIEVGGRLFVRNAEATGWERSRCSRDMRRSIETDGTNLSNVTLLQINQGDQT